MFNGWLSFAGNELLNDERVRAYAKHILPTIQMPTRCSDEHDLAGILDDAPYRTPLIDDAPWVDHDDPDTYGFAGALALSVSGLTDSSRTATVVQNSGDGGAALGRRYGTKEVRVTALLMGESNAAVEAGKRWLSAALSGGCDPCEPSDLCFLVGDGAGEMAFGDYVEEELPTRVLTGPAAYWHAGTGVFKPTNTTQAVSTPNAPSPLPCDEIRYHWRISSATVGTGITIETLGDDGITSSVVYAVPAAGGTFTISDRGISNRRSLSRLRVTSAPGEQVVISGVDMEFRTDGPVDACFMKYARQLLRVTCIAGPTTIEEYEPSAGAMEKVEFSFSAAPYIFGMPVKVLDVQGATIEKNVRSADVFQLSSTVPVCATPKRVPMVSDPDCPAVPVAPRSNVSVAACKPDPPFHTSYALAIPSEVIPLWAEAVPILGLRTNSLPARRVRVRFMPRPFETQAPVDLDPCSMCGEFVIDYIPANSTFTLDGLQQRAYLKQPGSKISDAGHLLSGTSPTTLFSWPVLTCGTGYLALVDLDTVGVGAMALSIATRES